MEQYKFPVGPHSYFKVRNLAESRERFIGGLDDTPKFTYGTATKDLIERRMSRVADQKVKLGLQLVAASIDLRVLNDAGSLELFRQINRKLYGEPTRTMAERILRTVRQRLKPSQKELWEYIEQTLGNSFEKRTRRGNIEKYFPMYRDYFERYATVSHYKRLSFKHTLAELLQVALDDTELTARGWSLLVREGDKHARTVYRKRFVSVGEGYSPRSHHAKLRIMVHEVFGHALAESSKSVEEAEGFATVLEQLTKSTYTFRRSYRYLAVALGWGVFGEPMNFRQVYEIIWRSMVIMSSYSENQAKQHAYSECVRAFRGGDPAIAGAVFLKDMQYFSANLKIWRELTKNPLTYEGFVAIIEGRKSVLK